MKICKYCDTECENEITQCSACGANEFKYKCGNCGNVYEDGFFCPNCGVKATQKAKNCPECGNVYYSNACPNCGYNGKEKTATPIIVNVTQEVKQKKPEPKKERKTWLWVLGWICMFPVPLTILMLKNEKIKKSLKITVIVIAWAVYLLIGLSGNRDTVASESTVNETTTVIQSETELSAEDGETDITVESENTTET